MRFCILVSAFCLLTSVGSAGLSGTYTIKPDGSGDFPDFQSAGNALVDSGMSGDCVFEAYTGYYTYGVIIYDVAGNDLWSITFRSAPGERPVVAEEEFTCDGLNRLTLENLTFEYEWPNFYDCHDCRISNCRFWPTGDFLFHSCSLFTITGNRIRNLGETDGVLLDDCPDFTIADNFLALSTSAAGGGALNAWWAPRLKLYYNTFWCPSEENEWVACVRLDDEFRADIRNNVFFLGRGCDTFSSCVQAGAGSADTFDFDYNCYYVDSAGFVGNWMDSLFVDLAGWQALGYDLHGLYGDPLFVDTSDLHLRQGSPCIGAGVPITGFEYDIDGDPRDPTHPDVGADEFMGSALEESPKPKASNHKLAASVMRSLPPGAVVFDAMGRRVVSLKTGVYFLGEPSGARGQGPGGMHKVVIQR